MKYKDMTFCPYYEFCKDGATCLKALTKKVKTDAQVWWLIETKGKETDAPIDRHVAIPICFVGKK